MEVVLNPPLEETETMASTLEGNSQEKDDSIAQEIEEAVGQPSNPVQQEITPEKSQIADEMTAKSNESIDEQLVKAETTATPDVPINVSDEADAPSEMKATDGFLTPSKKHQIAVVASKETATEMEGAIVTNNPYLPLTSLGTTRSQGTSPKSLRQVEAHERRSQK
jgi:hypothetical protein